MVEIDNDNYGLEEIKDWADSLERPISEIQDMVNNWDEKQWAVFAHYDFDTSLIDDIDDLDIDTDTVHVNGEDIYVLTDSEADDLADEMLDSYIEDCILNEIPERYQYYFDDAKFKDDVLRYDGRGSQIASYDGCENWNTVNGTDYYIYRTN